MREPDPLWGEIVRLYLSIMEGEEPEDAMPILATSDPDLIRSVALEIASRLGVPVVHDRQGVRGILREDGRLLDLVRDDDG